MFRLRVRLGEYQLKTLQKSWFIVEKIGNSRVMCVPTILTAPCTFLSACPVLPTGEGFFIGDTSAANIYYYCYFDPRLNSMQSLSFRCALANTCTTPYLYVSSRTSGPCRATCGTSLNWIPGE